MPLQDHLQGDDAVQADLPGLVDHAHAAAGDDLQQLVVAEVADTGQLAGLLRAVRGAVGLVGQPQVARLAVNAGVVGEEIAEPAGQLGMAGQQRFPVGHDAGLDLLEVLGDHGVERIMMGAGRFDGSGHAFTPTRAAARARTSDESGSIASILKKTTLASQQTISRAKRCDRSRTGQHC